MLVKLEALKKKLAKSKNIFKGEFSFAFFESRNKMMLAKLEGLEKKIAKSKDIFHKEFTFVFFEFPRDCKISLLFFVTLSG